MIHVDYANMVGNCLATADSTERSSKSEDEDDWKQENHEEHCGFTDCFL